MILNRLLFGLLLLIVSPAGVLAAAASPAPVEDSLEASFQLDLLVPQGALDAFLPAGFKSNIATQGPAKDCNLRVIFIDRVTVNGPDGAPIGSGSDRLVQLAAPVIDPSGETAQLIIGGLTTNPEQAPGPFGNYLLATTHSMRRSVSEDSSGTVLETQDWLFQAATGERLEFHITFERGSANLRVQPEVKYYSSKIPGAAFVARQERVLDILKNVTTNPPDRVRESSMDASGGSFAALFAGPEHLLSWDNILWMRRTVSQP